LEAGKCFDVATMEFLACARFEIDGADFDKVVHDDHRYR
jgi:hypothetical protein